jgi:hypothetical protein
MKSLLKSLPVIVLIIGVTLFGSSAGALAAVITLEGPSVTSFEIDSGAASTTSRTVTLYNTAVNAPTHYMASESSTFVRAR